MIFYLIMDGDFSSHRKPIQKEVFVRVKICCMMLGVMAAVSIGVTFDISAYGYEPPLQEACMEEEPMVVSGDSVIYEIEPTVNIKHIDKAAEEVEEELQRIEEEKQRKNKHRVLQ